MTEDEVEAVAEELAKAGGTAWYPGRERGQETLLRIVTDRHREQARAVIAALDRMRAGHGPAASAAREDQARGSRRESDEASVPEAGRTLRPGATVIYRPPGDQRAYPCRVVEIRGSRAYLSPILRTCIGWISIESLGEPPKDETPGES